MQQRPWHDTQQRAVQTPKPSDPNPLPSLLPNPLGPTEITAFSDRHAEFKKLGTEVLGVSVDSQFTHLAWIQTDRKEGGLGG
jgi:hypothetical protein